jgi:hypothetical protein
LRKIFYPVIFILFAGISTVAAGPRAAAEDEESVFIKPGEDAPGFALKDQYDRSRSLESLGGRLVAVVYADKDGSKKAGALVSSLNARYNSEKDKKGNPIIRVVVLQAAYLADVPSVLQPTVKKFFKSDNDEEKLPPVLLDWGGVIAGGYGYEEKLLNVYVIDADGKAAFAGAMAGKKDNDGMYGTLDSLAGRRE